MLQTAPADTLRITYDPTDLTKPPYALIEPAATNMIMFSQTFSSWYSNGDSGTVYNYGVAPDGSTTSTVVSSGTRYMSVNITAGTVYTYSEFVRPVSGTLVRLFGDALGSATFNLVGSGTLDSTYGTSATAIQKLQNGWYRVSMTFVAPTTKSQPFHLMPYSGCSMEFWGAQLETGSVATSYFKEDNGSYANRAADALSGTGLIYSNLAENDYAAWSAATVYKTGDRVLDLASHTIYESATGLTGTATFTAASAGNVVMKDSTGAVFVPVVNTPVVFTGSVPTGVTAGTVYYVQATTTSAFSIAVSVGGAAITTGAQATAISATASNNYNTPISNAVNWLKVGNDNKWAMFDQSVTSQSTNATGNVQVVIAPGQRVDSVVGMNVNATKAKVAMTDTVTGNVVYSKTVNLTSNSGITDMFAYFYEPIVRSPDFVATDLPVGPSSNCLITVTFEDAISASVGGLIVGQAKDLGITESSAKVGIIDYSVKTQDDFGNYKITPRAFSKKADYTVRMDSDTVDFVYNLLAKYRSTPIVYVGSNDGSDTDQYNSTVVYGFYKDMSIEIAYKTVSICTLSIEGLT